jgi:hypothetical protein
MLKNGFSVYQLLWHIHIQKIPQIQKIQVWLELLYEYLQYYTYCNKVFIKFICSSYIVKRNV